MSTLEKANNYNLSLVIFVISLVVTVFLVLIINFVFQIKNNRYSEDDIQIIDKSLVIQTIEADEEK